MNALYDLYYTMEKILNRVQDVNEARYISENPKDKQWIYPTIPTKVDNQYPRITVQISNLEEAPISAGGYISDNFNSEDNLKYESTGKLYFVTVWIGMWVKREMPGKIEMPDKSVKKLKNTLLGNLLFMKVLEELDRGTKDIKEVSYNYKPFEKEIGMGYDDSVNRIQYDVSIKIPVLSESIITYDETELIQTIINNIEATN
jgi:hypothetical protein